MLTNRYKSAMQFAATLHDGHLRKGTQVAYLSHLMSVSALVMESGGDEDEAIAALLHDSIEDRGNAYESPFEVQPRAGRDALKRDIELQFGAAVLSIAQYGSTRSINAGAAAAIAMHAWVRRHVFAQHPGREGAPE